jgi:hypothetical protein
MRALALLLCLIASPALAQPLLQWDNTGKTMHAFISEGYELKAVTTNHALVAANPKLGTTTSFFLQKTGALIRCVEHGKTDPTAPEFPPYCIQLIKPRTP